jgi:hypothetical protein
MRRNKSGDGVKRRGLAAAIGAKQGYDTALGHFQRDVGYADQITIMNLQMLDLE